MAVSRRQALPVSDQLPTVSAAPGAPTLTLNGHKVSGLSAEQQDTYAAVLAQLEELLMLGQRRDALTAATDAGLFDHALVIASSVDKDTWRATVEKFIYHGLNNDQSMMDTSALEPPRPSFLDSRRSSVTNSSQTTMTGGNASLSPNLRLSRANLQVAYSLLASQSPVWAKDFFSQQCVGEEVHAVWPAAAALIISSRTNGDSSFLLAIGDGLRAQGRFIAAQFLYLLAPPQVVFGSAEGARLTLVGADSVFQDFAFRRNVDHIYLTEIVEFALSLAPTPKGVEQFAGLPHLQAFKLLHAYQLAEAGDTAAAAKYCEAISTAIKAAAPSKPIPVGGPQPGAGYYHLTLLEQLKQAELLFAPNSQNKSSWTNKIQRPTIDGMGGALEGFLTKFIAGDDENSTPPKPDNATPKDDSAAVGPFSHFSAITPEAIGVPERAPSVLSLRAPSPYQRAPSVQPGLQAHATDPNGLLTPLGAAQRQVEAGHPQHHPAGPTRAQTPGMSAAYSSYTPPNGLAPPTDPYAPSTAQASVDPYPVHATTSNVDPYAPSGEESSDVAFTQGAQPDQYASGFESHAMEAEATVVPEERALEGAQTPSQNPPSSTDQEEEFAPAEEGSLTSPSDDTGAAPMYGEAAEASSDGFMQMADVPDFGTVPASESGTAQAQEPNDDPVEDDDDLGLGNSGGNSRKANEEVDKKKKEEEEAKSKAKAREAEEASKQAGGGWLSRLFNKKQSTTEDGKPVFKAHLGEKTTMYYDKELKRWVKPGQEAPAAASAPPPPPRGAAKSAPKSEPPTRASTPAAPPMSEQGEGNAPSTGPPKPTSSSASTDDHAKLQPPQASNPPGAAAKSAPASTAGSGPPSSGTPTPVGKNQENALSRPAPNEPTPGPPRAARNKKKPLSRRYVPID